MASSHCYKRGMEEGHLPNCYNTHWGVKFTLRQQCVGFVATVMVTYSYRGIIRLAGFSRLVMIVEGASLYWFEQVVRWMLWIRSHVWQRLPVLSHCQVYQLSSIRGNLYYQ